MMMMMQFIRFEKRGISRSRYLSSAFIASSIKDMKLSALAISINIAIVKVMRSGLVGERNGLMRSVTRALIDT